MATLWTDRFQRLLFIGGDWKGWLARAPAEVREGRNIMGHQLAEALAAEAKLLAALRTISRQ